MTQSWAKKTYQRGSHLGKDINEDKKKKKSKIRAPRDSRYSATRVSEVVVSKTRLGRVGKKTVYR